MIKKCVNKIFRSSAILLLFVMFLFVGAKNAQAQYFLYYPADALSLYGTPSIFVPPPAPTGVGLLPSNLYYPAIGAPPAVLVSPPTITASPIVSTTLSRLALTTYNPVAASSILSLLSPLASVAPAVPPTSVYNLYYPAVGSVPGIPVLPPVATGVGVLPFNLYSPPGTTPAIPVLPPSAL